MKLLMTFALMLSFAAYAQTGTTTTTTTTQPAPAATTPAQDTTGASAVGENSMAGEKPAHIKKMKKHAKKHVSKAKKKHHKKKRHS